MKRLTILTVVILFALATSSFAIIYPPQQQVATENPTALSGSEVNAIVSFEAGFVSDGFSNSSLDYASDFDNLSDYSGDFSAGVKSVPVVPEPMTMILLGMGLAGIGILRRK